MVMFYSPSFDCTEVAGNYGSVTFGTSGKTSVTITIASLANVNYYAQTQPWINHVLSSQWLGQDLRQSRLLSAQPGETVASQTQIRLRAEAALNSWTSPTSITVTFNTSVNPPIYTFAYPTAFTSISFSTSMARQTYGFSGNFSGSSASVSGTTKPFWIVIPSTDGASNSTGNYEPETRGSLGVSSGGAVYGVMPTANMICRDWVQEYETKAGTYREFASGQMTLQAIFERARSSYPFAVCNGFGDTYNEAFFLKSTAFTARRASPGNDDQFHVPFQCIVAGRSA